MTTFVRMGLVQNLQCRSSGFVLPYVLLVIAILAAIGTIAADRLMETSRLMQSVDAFSKAELAFASAEAQTTFSLLTSNPVKMGFDISGAEVSPINIFLDEEGKGEPIDLWKANGEKRQAQTQFGPVYVEIQDVSGLISLNTSSQDKIISFLMTFGISKETATRLSATLEDYRDRDHTRSFRGAERADYRLRGLEPPTNAPLRNYAELNAILDWPQALQNISINDFKRLTTLSGSTGPLNPNFAPAELISFLQNADDKFFDVSGDDIFGSSVLANNMPSNRTRLTFTYISTEDMVWQRVIEIERLNVSAKKPFKRYWILDESLPISSLTLRRSDELKNVVYTGLSNSR